MNRYFVPALLLSMAVSCAGAGVVSDQALEPSNADIRLEVFGMD